MTEITFNEAIGNNNELSEILQKLVDSGEISEKRAYEIKQQITEEYNTGKVKDEGIIYRIIYLINDLSLRREVGVLRETLDANKKLCPYCLDKVQENDEYCSLCGYDLTHKEEVDLSNVKIIEKDDDIDFSSYDKKFKESGMEKYLENINPIQFHRIFSLNKEDETRYKKNNTVDLFNILNNMKNYSSFDEMNKNVLIYSETNVNKLIDTLTEKNYIVKNDSKKIGYEITEEGYAFIIENDWIFFYNDYLQQYSFDDFSEYYKNSPYKIGYAGLEFLNKHIDLAYKNRDFDRLVRSYITKGYISDYTKDYDESLKSELKAFMLNLNPPYLDAERMGCHKPLMSDNAYILYKYGMAYDVNSLKKMFVEQWDSIDFENDYFSKPDAWGILKEVLLGRDADEINNKEMDRYI